MLLLCCVNIILTLTPYIHTHLDQCTISPAFAMLSTIRMDFYWEKNEGSVWNTKGACQLLCSHGRKGMGSPRWPTPGNGGTNAITVETLQKKKNFTDGESYTDKGEWTKVKVKHWVNTQTYSWGNITFQRKSCVSVLTMRTWESSKVTFLLLNRIITRLWAPQLRGFLL